MNYKKNILPINMAYNNSNVYGEVSEGESAKTSKYNSGWAQIERIDLIWRDAHKHSRAGLYKDWNGDIDRVWVELAGDLNDNGETKTKIEEFDVTTSKLFDEYGKQASQTIKVRIYKNIMEKEIFIRKLQNTLGKGTALKDIDEDDFE